VKVAVSLDDLQEQARSVLSPGVWDFVAGGSGAETSLAANRRALDAVSVYPRVLAGTAPVTEATLLGTRCAMPIAVAPMAYQRLVHPDGELAMAEAAQAAGIPMTAATLSSYSVDEIAKTGAALWFQVYWLRERDQLASLIDRAGAAGSTALMVTVDVPIMGRRLRDIRNEFSLPSDVIAANLTDGAASTAHQSLAGRSAVAAHTGEMLGPALSWADLEWLRSRTDLPLAVKGILDPRDAVRAVEMGADAVVVSNHGGRQFDGAPASITALQAVVAELAGRCEVLLDSGIRSGVDVLKALALGASGVLIGRPLLWALALDGAAGVSQALALLATEITEALTLTGCRNLAAATQLRTNQGVIQR
jgi:4-hydroxymandelate oxidase